MRLDEFDVESHLLEAIDPRTVYTVLSMQAETSENFLSNIGQYRRLLPLCDEYLNTYKERFLVQSHKCLEKTSEMERKVEKSAACSLEVHDDAMQLLAECILRKVDKMSHQLVVLYKRRKRGKACAFPSPVHQVLHMNRLSILDLYNCASRVIKRHSLMSERLDKRLEECNKKELFEKDSNSTSIRKRRRN